MSAAFLIVRVAGDRVAIPAERVHSVIEVGVVTPAPRAPDFIAGLTSLRSRTLTVIDTAKALGLDEESAQAALAVVLDSDGCGYALLVEEVENVEIAEAKPCRPDVRLADGWKRVTRGLVETPAGSLLIADPDLVVAGPQRRDAA